MFCLRVCVNCAQLPAIITFDYNEGMIVGKGNLEVGNPYKVEAFCNNCNHEWTLKGVTQIVDVSYNIA